MPQATHDDSHAIVHRIEIEADPAAVFAAITEPNRLAAWWTTRVDATPRVGHVAAFMFGNGSTCRMRIDELRPVCRVRWTCVEGAWPGMTLTYDIEPHARGAALRFEHAGWPERSDFYGHCNAKWGFFLAVSLKSLLETGTGTPHPHEPRI